MRAFPRYQQLIAELRDEARRITADIAKLPERPRTGRTGYGLISISLLSRIVGDPALDDQTSIGAAQRKCRHKNNGVNYPTPALT